ncbi:uncharacterized protein [Parasteatoda tepidariorum]|uniref:uncharacterized protein n=1 Tax=Parasteatoda tepidariorum TaxID=114398 RepID=UPI00077F81E0|nr:uncharacterized protein LOC107443692 isoform X2 [Parasteatoda tepidariorum]
MLPDLFCRYYFSVFILICSCFCILKSASLDVNSTTGIRLGDPCKTPEQCQNFTPNSTCSDGVCSCEDGFFQLKKINSSNCESDAIDKTDEEYSARPPKVKTQHVDPKMIIIMVVLAVMFVGICVALHLFSKARFRNHRTIFNSPHPRLMHIKLGKKKGRRRASHTSLEVPGSRQLSICSQLSPLQSRRGSQATSPELSQKNRKTNGEKKDSLAHKTHKTDLSEKGIIRAGSDAPANGPGSPTVIVANSKNANKPNNSNSSARV